MEKLIIVSTIHNCVAKQEKEKLDALRGEDLVCIVFRENWAQNHTRIIVNEFPEAIFKYMKTQEELLQFLYESGVSDISEIREIPIYLRSLKPVDKEFLKRHFVSKEPSELTIEEVLKLLGCYIHEQGTKEYFDKMSEEEKMQYAKMIEVLEKED